MKTKAIIFIVFLLSACQLPLSHESVQTQVRNTKIALIAVIQTVTNGVNNHTLTPTEAQNYLNQIKLAKTYLKQAEDFFNSGDLSQAATQIALAEKIIIAINQKTK